MVFVVILKDGGEDDIITLCKTSDSVIKFLKSRHSKCDADCENCVSRTILSNELLQQFKSKLDSEGEALLETCWTGSWYDIKDKTILE